MVNVIKKNTHTQNALCQNSVCRPFKSQAITLNLYLFPFLGYTLKCNRCLSYVSWEECTRNNTVTCRFPEDHCGTLYVKWIEAINDTFATGELFVKKCVNSSKCNKTNLCSRVREEPFVKELIKCEVRCCQGDLCNRYQERQNGALVPSTKIIPGKNWTK